MEWNGKQAQTATLPDYNAEIDAILKSNLAPKAMGECLSNYHDSDLADALEDMNPIARKRLLTVLEPECLSDVLEYVEDSARTAEYLNELDLKKRVAVLDEMDSDRLADLMKALPAKDRADMMELIDEAAKKEIALIGSFDENEIGSRMSTNYVSIPEDLTIKQAMRSVVQQAAESDNISTIYALDQDGCYCGAFDLKSLIIAREGDDLHDLIVAAFPYVYAWEPIDECVERLKDYEEDSIPVLDSNNHLLGVLTSQDLVQLVDDEMGDDYAKLAGLASEEELHEPVRESVKKRLPWLIILLGLGLVVSSVVGIFETVVQRLTLVICFQSLILDMSGNVGTQSLAVTIRVLMDENLTGGEKWSLVVKELKVGFTNGLLLGSLSVLCIGCYIYFFMHTALSYAFAISGCIGAALLLAMVISSLTGTIIPIFFKKIKIDPAVASGPLITTVNDLVAVVTYYGLAWLFLLVILHLA